MHQNNYIKYVPQADEDSGRPKAITPEASKKIDDILARVQVSESSQKLK
jgi:hypothetical protein